MNYIKTILLLIPIVVFSQSNKITSQEKYFDSNYPTSENVIIMGTGAIASKFKGFIYKTVKISLAEEIKIDTSIYHFEKDEIFVNKYKVGKYLLYQSLKDTTIGIAKKVNNPKCFFYKFIKDELMLGREIKNVKLHEIKPIVTERKIYFHEYLQYRGRIGNILNFTYYQYINQNDQADVTEEIEFDLSKNAILQCRKLKIKILNADERSIEFVKFKNF